jgi:hypothetical protein
MLPLGFQIAGLQIDPHILWDGLAGALGGGAISSIITVISERRSKRMEVALEIVEQFMSQYGELAVVLGLLDSPQSLQDPLSMNKVRKFGDWCEIVSAVCLENAANRALLKRIGVPTAMKDFQRRAQKAAPQAPKLDYAVKSWTNLQEYVQKETV